jgi:hypothetical protein
MNNTLLLEASAWAQNTFGEVRLGDKRRTERAVRIATKMAAESDMSLPRMMKSKAELEAAYRLLETPDVTYEALVRPHVQQTREQAQSQKRVLLIQDTTDLKYSHHPKTRGLGPLDTVSISKGEGPAANRRREHGKHPTRTDRSIGHAVAELADKERLQPLGNCQRKEPDETCVAVDD